MDSIHIKEHRPAVALVLSGGGAKGAAHVGVLRYLEEQGIPIDMVCGTSIGGLVGGMTALGYDSMYLDSLFRHQDWSRMLTDRIDQSYYSYSRKRYKETYSLAIPFHYAKKDFQSRIDDQILYVDGGKHSVLGENSLASSLPSGYVYGFNVNNLLSSVSVGYQDAMSFADLPIPFFCVAADIVSLKAKNWSSGSLKDAMRSTMSIPGLFKPVRYRGTILVDGGVRNNFPVDIARAMGADIVIGVDLSDLNLTYSQVNNLGDILMQFIDMLGKTTFDKNVGEADVFIKPVLSEYNMLSFTPDAIDTMIDRGYAAASRKAEELAEIKELTKGADMSLQSPRATDIGQEAVPVYSIEFTGLTNSESRMLHRKIKLKAGDSVTKDEMQRVMSLIQATGCFSSVTYNILGHEAPYRLVINCVKGPRDQFGMGVRLDTEEWPSFIFNVGLNAHKLSGVKLDLDAKIGRNQMFSVRSALDVSWLPTLNLDATLRNVSSTLITDLGEVGNEARWWGHAERLYLSNISWTSVDIKAGVQLRQFFLPYGTAYGASIYSMDYLLTRGSYLGYFANGTVYTYDRSNYPSRGVDLNFGYENDFRKLKSTSFSPLRTAYLNFTSVVQMGKHFALVPDLHMRALFGNPEKPSHDKSPDLTYSLAHQNYVGGMLANRYIPGQIPFIGFGDVYQADPYVAVLGMGLRAQIGRNLFLTASGAYFREEENLSGFLDTLLPTLWGAGFEIGYNTPIGPIKVVTSWSDRFHDWKRDLGLYVSFGFDF